MEELRDALQAILAERKNNPRPKIPNPSESIPTPVVQSHALENPMESKETEFIRVEFEAVNADTVRTIAPSCYHEPE